MHHDVFISHASEDKESIVRELAALLQARGVAVWYDEHSMSVGDSLIDSIGTGLADSAFGIVVISPHFLMKQWPKRELAALFAREDNGCKVVLPLWHLVTREDVAAKLPLLADRVALNTNIGLTTIVEKILSVVAPERRAQALYKEARDRESVRDFKAARAGYIATLRIDGNHAAALAGLLRIELPGWRRVAETRILLGRVSWYSPQKGYGFVTAEDGRDIFVHVTSLERNGLRSLEPGNTVAFLMAEKGDKQAIASIRTLEMPYLPSSDAWPLQPDE